VDSKAGRQPVTTVLTGLASHATPGGRQETTFLCLLAKPERAVFFHLNPGGTRVIDSSADPLKTCLDLVGSQAGVDGCLAARLRDAETMLDGVVAAKGRELESLERAGSRSGAPAVLAQAQDAWLTFRNTTCRLEGAAAKSDASALDFERACQVRLTLERAIALGTH